MARRTGLGSERTVDKATAPVSGYRSHAFLFESNPRVISGDLLERVVRSEAGRWSNQRELPVQCDPSALAQARPGTVQVTIEARSIRSWEYDIRSCADYSVPPNDGCRILSARCMVFRRG